MEANTSPDLVVAASRFFFEVPCRGGGVGGGNFVNADVDAGVGVDVEDSAVLVARCAPFFCLWRHTNFSLPLSLPR